jgi:hypothetical protein
VVHTDAPDGAIMNDARRLSRCMDGGMESGPGINPLQKPQSRFLHEFGFPPGGLDDLAESRNQSSQSQRKKRRITITSPSGRFHLHLSSGSTNLPLLTIFSQKASNWVLASFEGLDCPFSQRLTVA